MLAPDHSHYKKHFPPASQAAAEAIAVLLTCDHTPVKKPSAVADQQESDKFAVPLAAPGLPRPDQIPMHSGNRHWLEALRHLVPDQARLQSDSP